MDEQTALLVFGIFTGLACLIVAISFAVFVSRSTRK